MALRDKAKSQTNYKGLSIGQSVTFCHQEMWLFHTTSIDLSIMSANPSICTWILVSMGHCTTPDHIQFK